MEVIRSGLDRLAAAQSLACVFFFFFCAPFLWFVPPKTLLKGSRRAREAHKPFVPRGPPAVRSAARQPASGEGRLTCICKKLTQGWERTVGMAECPARWVKVAAKADMAAWDRSVDQRATSTATRLDRRRTGTSRALARARARTKEAASSLHRPPTSTAPSGAAPGMSALCGGVQGQGRRLEHDHPGGRAAPSRTREIPMWCPRRAAARPTTASLWQRPQAAGRRHDRPGDSCLPSGCCKSPSRRPRGTLARRPAREGTRGSGGHPSTGCGAVAEGGRGTSGKDRTGRGTWAGALLRPEQGLAGWVQAIKQLLTLAAGNS